MQELFDRIVFGNPVQDWFIAIGVAIGVTLGLGLLKRFALSRLAQWASRTETDIDDLAIDLVRRIHRMFLLVLGIWLGLKYLHFEEPVDQALRVLIHLNLFAQLGLWGIGGVDYLIKRTLGTRGPDDPGARTGATILGFIGRVVVWTLTALLILKNAFHQDITALLTGLGVGGIAIALALQNVLGDLFASVTILLDKPFVIGDSVTVGEFTGTIESIGIKTTRLKSINGEQIVMGNADLVNSRLRNFKRIEERRVVFSLGVTYQTPTAKLERIPAILKGIIESTPEVRFDRAHWKNYGDFALNFEAAYFVQKQEYNAMMDAQQSINIAVWRAFEAEGIEFAYPTQTVIVSGARQP